MNPLLIPPPLAIIYLEADINYTIFHLNDGQKFISSFTLKKYETALKEYDFLRINKSNLVNPSYVKCIEKTGRKATIELKNGMIVTIARRRMNHVKGALQNTQSL